MAWELPAVKFSEQTFKRSSFVKTTRSHIQKTLLLWMLHYKTTWERSQDTCNIWKMCLYPTHKWLRSFSNYCLYPTHKWFRSFSNYNFHFCTVFVENIIKKNVKLSTVDDETLPNGCLNGKFFDNCGLLAAREGAKNTLLRYLSTLPHFWGWSSTLLPKWCKVISTPQK